MTRKFAITVLTLGIAAFAGGYAMAQGAGVSAAMASGAVGEQADGYLGFRSAPSAGLRAEVDAINIKRRAEYTSLAEKRGVTIKDVAAAIGCKTLSTRVQPGQAYLLADGQWRVRDSGPIPLPDYCA